MKRVVCAGTFDHLHPGHIDYLLQAKALGDELVVIVARDETVARIKGIRPEHDENRRKTDVEATGIPMRVVLGNLEQDLFFILGELAPDIIALGYDQRVSEEDLKTQVPACTVVRLKPFHPDRFKSSFYRAGSQGGS
ncbi:MAG TPA: adenylyltransferase/cytidyltransferase family protein [Thermodesulfovibrionales bacterium]|nr:adenylyltransferase/cytidyltransferase family protein [Thermodesulfovibrionales bacterium]